MGSDKLSRALAGRSPLERIRRLLAGRSVVLVVSKERSQTYAAQIPQARIVVNERPQDGMTSSLRSAIPLLGHCDRIGIMLADKPLLLRATLERLERDAATSQHDVVYPISNAGEPGHPVFLSRNAAETAMQLPNGDTLRALRTDSSLAIRAVECHDAGAYLDIDTEADVAEAEELARERDL
jgi:CTP:molybdopterin cytidylyltransferase MocA